MEHAPVPLRFGTLVVFTDGTDRAHRASAEDVDRTLDARPAFETYVIGVGQEVDSKQLSRIGRSGTFASQNRADVQHGFDEIVGAHRGGVEAFYLLSYCSPRAPASTRSRSRRTARGPAAGSAYRFNANGFGPNCDPNTRPPFDMKHPRQPAPEASDERPPSGGPPPAKGGPTWNPKR